MFAYFSFLKELVFGTFTTLGFAGRTVLTDEVPETGTRWKPVDCCFAKSVFPFFFPHMRCKFLN
jgi:hypothetical protein